MTERRQLCTTQRRHVIHHRHTFLADRHGVLNWFDQLIKLVGAYLVAQCHQQQTEFVAAKF
jgi:hypothetical protein